MRYDLSKRGVPFMNKSKNIRKRKDYLLIGLGIAVAVTMVVMVIALCIPKEVETGEFIPPAFESAAVVGTPDVPEGLGYSSPYQDGMAYRFLVCGNVKMDGNKATVYLTNDAENDVYLKVRVLDEGGNTLGETGLIKPGEYVKDVELSKALAAGTSVKLKIMSYDPETYMSMGSAVMNTTIGGAVD